MATNERSLLWCISNTRLSEAAIPFAFDHYDGHVAATRCLRPHLYQKDTFRPLTVRREKQENNRRDRSRDFMFMWNPNGLYALVKQKYPDVVLKGRDLFDASLFRDRQSTAVFYTFISQLKRSIDSADPSPTHRFIKSLDAKKKLLRSYTQNIDGLEEKVGLLSSSSQEARSNGKGKTKLKAKEVRNVQLHGDIHRVRCVSCSADYAYTEAYLDMFAQGMPPDCPECATRCEERIARSARATRVGTLRPAIVLYDEPHPLGDDIGTIQAADVARKPDLLIIMGTSLKVHGLKKLVKDFAKAVHSNEPSTSTAKKWSGKVIFVNKTPPAAEWADVIDYHIAGDTDAWCNKVLEDWKKMRPQDWEIQQTLVATGGLASPDGGFKVAKGGVSKKEKASKKKPLAKENVAPSSSTDMVLSTPDAIAAMTIATPSSPSKRRGGTSHYADGESSPSKKRVSDTPQHCLPPEERVMLFGDHTNVTSVDVFNSAAEAEEEDIPMASPQRTRSLRRPKSLATVKPVKPVKATKTTTVGRRRGRTLLV
ncbi:hypothetical protein ONZ45_g1387 [Pleurotus djamor]|nr:hypothetical protein ONZ45_g1387 [Pleurotus djamor]